MSESKVPPVPSPYLKGALPKDQVVVLKPETRHEFIGFDGSDFPLKYDHWAFQSIIVCVCEVD